jgi:hypothetical protein
VWGFWLFGLTKNVAPLGDRLQSFGIVKLGGGVCYPAGICPRTSPTKP